MDEAFVCWLDKKACTGPKGDATYLTRTVTAFVKRGMSRYLSVELARLKAAAQPPAF